jgi:hypothetical protein
MKNLKSYISEGLLRGMENTLDDGQAALDAAMNVDTVPTVKDFKKHPWFNNMHLVPWYCPEVLAKYKKLYPDMIKREYTTMFFALEKEGRLTDLNIMIGENTDVTCRKDALPGWNDGYVAADIRKCKGFVINLIKKLANNPDKMDKLMKYAYEFYDHYTNKTDFGRDSKGNFKLKQVKSFSEFELDK